MNRARTIDMKRALSHPARRRLLRRLHDQDRPCHSLELARETGVPLSSITYHLRVLQLCRVTRSIEDQAVVDPAVRGHELAVADARWLRGELDATKSEDKADARSCPVAMKVSPKARRGRKRRPTPPRRIRTTSALLRTRWSGLGGLLTGAHDTPRLGLAWHPRRMARWTPAADSNRAKPYEYLYRATGNPLVQWR